MLPKIVDIVNILMRRYSNPNQVNIDERSLIEMLTDRGFSVSDITEAFEFIFSGEEILGCVRTAGVCSNCNPVRVLNPSESIRFDIRAQGLLHMLSVTSIATEDEIEMIIQSALSLDKFEVSSPDLLPIIHKTLSRASGDIPLLEYAGEVAASLLLDNPSH